MKKINEKSEKKPKPANRPKIDMPAGQLQQQTGKPFGNLRNSLNQSKPYDVYKPDPNKPRQPGEPMVQMDKPIMRGNRPKPSNLYKPDPNKPMRGGELMNRPTIPARGQPQQQADIARKPLQTGLEELAARKEQTDVASTPAEKQGFQEFINRGKESLDLKKQQIAAMQQAQSQIIGPAQQMQQMKEKLMPQQPQMMAPPVNNTPQEPPQASGATQEQEATQAPDNSAIDQQIAALQAQLQQLQAQRK